MIIAVMSFPPIKERDIIEILKYMTDKKEIALEKSVLIDLTQIIDVAKKSHLFLYNKLVKQK